MKERTLPGRNRRWDRRHGLLMVLLLILAMWLPGGGDSAGAMDYPFFDDMENTSSGNWVMGGSWGYTNVSAYSGSHSLSDSPGGSYPNDADMTATLSSSLDLTTALRPVLRFRHRHAFETNADYGFVEVSRDGGQSWSQLAFLTGVQADWLLMQIDLSEYAGGNDVRIRFHLVSNESTTYDGWYIDDVKVEEADALIPYPFFDNMEDAPASEARWLSASWKIKPPGANASALSWQGSGYYWNANCLTLGNAIDLRAAVQPQLSFWHKYNSAYLYVEISDNNGHEGTWQQVAAFNGTQGSWVQYQVDLSPYQGLPDVRIRFVNTYGGLWQIDDVRIEDTPWPHGSLRVSDATMHSARLRWDRYPWAVAGFEVEQPGFAGFSRYEVFRAKSENVSRTNGELIGVFTDQDVTEYLDDCTDTPYVVLQPDRYWYRLYVVDTNGMYSVGTNAAEAVYQVPSSNYPYTNDMEGGTAGWEWNCSWGITTQYAHSGTHSWTDSPNGNYGNNTDTALTKRLSLSNAVKPALRFWHRYAFETNADFGYVEVSRDGGQNWTRHAFVTGQQPDWLRMRIDLSEYAGGSDVRIRFRVTSDASTAYDGWYIDDVEVSEADAAISYPFFDDMENAAATESRWLPSSWTLETPGANGSNLSWQGGGYYWNPNSLTLGNTIDLRAAVLPQLTFWHKYNSSYLTVEVSDNNGHEGTWQQLATFYGTQDSWVQYQVDLSAYQGLPNVRIRFVNTYGGFWQIDDVRIEDSPWPHGSLRVSEVSMHSARLSWDRYPWGASASGPNPEQPGFAGFSRYEVYRAKSETVNRTNGELIAVVVDPAVTEHVDDCSETPHVILQPDYYWYRLYVVDTNGMYTVGSNAIQAVYQLPSSAYPYSNDMEGGTTGWEWNCPWGITTQYAHSGTHSWTDSPEGNYGNNTDSALTKRLNLLSANKPALRFWHRYSLESDTDFGFVEVSKDGGQNWARLAFVTGQQPDWVQMGIDLSEFAGGADVRIRFRLTSDGSTAYDGWYIDDVEVKETDAAISYPFFDDVENASVSKARWLPSSWQIKTPGANGSNLSWQGGGYYWNPNSLTLANTIDLRTAVQPQLSFWHKYNSSYLTVEVSDDSGHEGTWQQLATFYGAQDNWVQHQIDLSAFQGLPNVRIRFINTYGGLWQIDDVSIRGTEPTGPIPDIKANALDGPARVLPSQSVTITGGLNPGNAAGQMCDWWVGAYTPFGVYWLNSSMNWVPSSTPISVGRFALFNLSPTSIYNARLPEGVYTFFFVLDNAPDGVLKVTWYDFVNVIVSTTAQTKTGNLPDEGLLLKKLEQLAEKKQPSVKKRKLSDNPSKRQKN